jgi:general L-amino acid transport system permease protein
MATRVDTLEPVPAPESPPERRLPPREWARENLFGTWFDTFLTIAFGLIAVWLIYRLGRFVLVDARWEIIERNLTNLMVSRFPRDELWRVWAALLVLAASLGLGAGTTAAARRREVEELSLINK